MNKLKLVFAAILMSLLMQCQKEEITVNSSADDTFIC
jgi:hypothetical protein